MSTVAKASVAPEWKPVADPDGRFSSGIPDLDRLLGGGFRRGSFALFNTDASVASEDLHLLWTPIWINFLHQSRGIIAVLPARESPASFRSAVLAHVSRRLFDSRVRIVDYVGEDDDAPYVVSLRGLSGPPRGSRKAAMEGMRKMEAAAKAAGGSRGRPFLEFTALEILETIAGPEGASRMYLFGVKRTRAVGNLGIAVARPGLQIVDGVRSMMDYEFGLRRTELGLEISGVRPSFSAHVVVLDRPRGGPHVALVPSPPIP